MDHFASTTERAATTREHLEALSGMPNVARNATHLPIWSSGRRPVWWSNSELRHFLTESHRQMTLGECVSEAQRRFGQAVSVSSLHRYWTKLDNALGPMRAA